MNWEREQQRDEKTAANAAKKQPNNLPAIPKTKTGKGGKKQGQRETPGMSGFSGIKKSPKQAKASTKAGRSATFLKSQSILNEMSYNEAGGYDADEDKMAFDYEGF